MMNKIISIVMLFFSPCILFASDENISTTQIFMKTSFGSANGQVGFKVFESGGWIAPNAVAVDSKGNLYITDPLNNRIQKFNKYGQYIYQIKISHKIKSRTNEIPDIAVDNDDNLYVFSSNEQAILIFSPGGALTRTIPLKDLDIYWDKDKGRWDKSYFFQTDRIWVDKYGSIYLEGSNEFIKFSKQGNVINKWPQNDYSRASQMFIDKNGNLYLSYQTNSWGKYNKDGIYIGAVDCEKEPHHANFPQPVNSCHFPPQFIDKNGFSYHAVLAKDTEELTAILKSDKSGHVTNNYLMSPADVQTYWIDMNMWKFDNEGNLYGYGYDKAKREYWIEKITFP